MADTVLELSDAEFMNQDPSAFFSKSNAESQDLDTEMESSDQTEETVEASEESEESSNAQEQTVAEVDSEKVSQLDADTQTERETSDDSDDTESLDTSKKSSPDTNGDTQETKELDYESAYKKVTQPFKANGTEMQVSDPDDIVRLMQMGANYQKKMAQMKPNLKLIKMLENNGLLDEAKLHNLIDLSRKDPKAVAKLVKDSGLDPLDIDTEGSAEYRPTNYSVTDREYNLDQVLDEIKDSPTFTRTIDVLTKEWDSGSKATISDNPEIISVIDVHMNNGVFDKVNSVMQQEKALGKLAGISDVEAYRQIAEHLHHTGQLHNKQPKSETSTVSSETGNTSQTAEERNKKRKAVAPVKQTKSDTTPVTDNFLGLSDDDFMKKYASR